MSLDVYLEMPDVKWRTGGQWHGRSGIYVRRDGQTVEITRAEWDELHPDREPVTALEAVPYGCVYRANITHNLSKMAKEAGLYEALWSPQDVGFYHAEDLILPLQRGLAYMKKNPAHLRNFNPKNGWGSYDVLCDFTQDYLAACERWPEAEVQVSV